VPRVIVQAENAPGQAVVRRVNVLVSDLFEGDPRVTMAESDGEFEFYRRRKIFLMNGIHIIMSVMTYKSLIGNGIPKAEWDAQFINILHCLPDIRETTDLFRRVQVARLVVENKHAIGSIYPNRSASEVYQELWKYSEHVQARVHSHPDTVQRISPDTNPEKLLQQYLEKCGDVRRFVSEHWDEIEQLGLPGTPSKKTLCESLSKFEETIRLVGTAAMAKQ
jgi:hypothetical protein